MMNAKLLLGALCAALSLSALAAPAKKPNILLIVADDLGYSDTQPFGGEIQTPNLQSMADEGIRLTSMYAGPTCSVTRSMLLSGTDNHVAGMGTMAGDVQPAQKGKPGYEEHLNFRVATAAELLRAQGYHTYMSGKWHLGGAPGQTPMARGFERSLALIPGGAAHLDQGTLFPSKQPAKYLRDDNEITLPSNFYSSDYYTDELLGYLKQKDDKPFFAYLAYTAPHWPLQVPDAYLNKYKGRYAEGYEAIRQARLKRMQALGIVAQGTVANVPFRSYWPSWEQLTPEQRSAEARTMEIYAAMVDNLDHNIGRVLAQLKADGELDNTFILFMSDNGSEGASGSAFDINDWIAANFDNSPSNMGRKNSYLFLGPQWGQVGATPFPFYKGFTAMGGVRVPAIVRYPAAVKGGGISAEVLHVMDLMPTALSLAGGQYPKQFAGHDLMPLEGRSMLASLAGQVQPQRALSFELYGRRAVRKGDWTLLQHDKPYGNGQWELYNLKSDPSALHNVAARYPEKVKELAVDYQDYTQRNGVIEAPGQVSYSFRNCFLDRCVED